MRFYRLLFVATTGFIALLVLFRRPFLPATGAECLQLTDAYYHRAMIDLNTGKQIGTLNRDDDTIYYNNLSPDHNSVAYFGEQPTINQQSVQLVKYQLVVQQAHVINHKQSFAFNPDNYNSLAIWSPDSRVLAYVWETNDYSVNLMLVDKIGGEIGHKKLFDVESSEDVVTFNGWSADGKYLSVSYRTITAERTNNTTLVISVPDLSIVKTLNDAAAIGRYPFLTAGWSASGHWLALRDVNTNSPMLVSPDKDKPIVDQLPDNDPYWWQGWWNFDGELLAIISSYGARIDVLGADGQIEQQITDKADNVDLNYDEGTFLFEFQDAEPTSYFGYAGDGGPGLPPNIYWLADGSTLIFTERPDSELTDYPDELNLVVYDHSTRKKLIIVRNLITNPQITQDKNYVFYARRKDEKYVIEVLDTTTLQSTTLQPDENDLFRLKGSGVYGWYSQPSKTLLLWDSHWVSFIQRGNVLARYKSHSTSDMWRNTRQTDDSRHVILFETASDEAHRVLSMNVYDLDSATENRIMLPSSVVFSRIQGVSVTADQSLIAIAFTDNSNTARLLVMNRQGEVVRWIERNDLDAITELAFGSCDM